MECGITDYILEQYVNHSVHEMEVTKDVVHVQESD